MTKAEGQSRGKGNLWTRDKIAHLIQLYRENECLWNHRITEMYKSKNMRALAVTSICEELNVSKADYCKKIHNLRNQFNSEMKKLERRIEGSGGKVEDNTSHSQKCRWEHFESLMFLRTVIEPRPGGYQPSPMKKMRIKYDYNSDEETTEHLMNQAETTSAVASLPVEVENTDYVYEDGADHINYEETVATEDPSPEQPSSNEKCQPAATETAQISHERLPIPTTATLTTSSNCGYADAELLTGKIEEVAVLQSTAINNLSNYSQLTCHPNVSTTITTTTNELAGHSKELNAPKPTTTPGGRDQWDIFGELLASEFRNFNSDISRKKLKRKIMQAMLEVGEEDDQLKA